MTDEENQNPILQNVKTFNDFISFSQNIDIVEVENLRNTAFFQFLDEIVEQSMNSDEGITSFEILEGLNRANEYALEESMKTEKTNTLQIFARRFNQIKDSKDNSTKEARLTNLMNDLEQAFRIPVFQNDVFEKKYPEVIKLYRDVSFARDM